MDISENELRSLLETAYEQGALGTPEFANEYASKVIEGVLESKKDSMFSGYILTAAANPSFSHDQLQNIDVTYYFQGADAITTVASDQIKREKNG